MADMEKIIEILEKAKTVIENWVPMFEQCNTPAGIDDAIALLKEQEAKTGYWIDSAGYDKCSICGAEYSDLYPDYSNTHFCPNCGAKMEGGDGE